MFARVRTTSCILYADDTAVVCSTPNLALTMSSLQNSAQVVDMYLVSKMMQLNASKTHYMLFGVSSELSSSPLRVSTGQICGTESFKSLGIWLDSFFSF